MVKAKQLLAIFSNGRMISTEKSVFERELGGLIRTFQKNVAQVSNLWIGAKGGCKILRSNSSS